MEIFNASSECFAVDSIAEVFIKMLLTYLKRKRGILRGFCFVLGPTTVVACLYVAICNAEKMTALETVPAAPGVVILLCEYLCCNYTTTSSSSANGCMVFHVNRFLASKNIPVAHQPTYSPDLSPCDFFLFPKLKNHLKGHHFGTLKTIQTAVTDQLKAIPISEFHQGYEEWKKRLQRCVASEGRYFEGDNVEL
ncbi:putative transposase [Trichonephila clavipes]|nr:putative transposase [Trichonephila clavipes]